MSEPDSLEWDDLSLILAIGRSESLSGAARELGQTHSTIFRRINAVEKRTGVRFFDRFRTGYVPTDAGRMALASAQRIEREVTVLGREVLGRDGRLSGPIRVTCPELFADSHAVRIAAAFTALHPGIRLDVLPGRANVDLERHEAEVAIRATREPPGASWGRKICGFALNFYASRAYAEAHRDAPLEDLRFALIDGTVGMFVPRIWPDVDAALNQIAFQSPAVRAVQNACAAGIGISALPAFSADADDRLVRVNETEDWLGMSLWVLTHPDLRGTARVRALMSHLYDDLGSRADLFAGRLPQPGAIPLVDIPTGEP